MSDLELFDIYNPKGQNQKKSRVEHLHDICAFHNEWLLNAANRLEDTERPNVVAFFQIPRPIFVEDFSYILPGTRAEILIEFQFIPFLLQISNQGQLNITPSRSGLHANATQIIATVPLWGKRANYFDRYRRCFNRDGMKNEQIMDNTEFWENRTLRATDFEVEISTRILPELKFALRRFLKSYSVIRKNLYLDMDILFNYFIMTHPYRLVSSSAQIPLITHFLACHTELCSDELEANKVLQGVSFTYRTFSRFEVQIFELNKLAKAGSHSLALIGSLALIEWMLKLMARRDEKSLPMSKLIERFIDRGLPRTIRNDLNELRILRNTAVHLGEYSHSNQKKPHHFFEFDIDKAIGKDTADKAIDIAWTVFVKANSGDLTRD